MLGTNLAVTAVLVLVAQGLSLAQTSSSAVAANDDGTPQPIPQIMHFCAAHCSTLTWVKDHFTREADPGGSKWTVESFTRQSVVIRRVDERPRPYSAIYKAPMSSDGNRIDGNGFTFTWGAALHSIPGSDEERDNPSASQQPSGSTARPQLAPTGKIDLSGMWLTRLVMPNKQVRSVKMRITQDGDEVKAGLEGNGSNRDGIISFEGRFSGGLTIDGRSLDSQATVQKPHWTPEKISIEDPDHIRFEKGPLMFVRLAPHAGDVPCDTANSYRVKPGYALLRGGNAVFEQKDYVLGACWLRIAANEGNARSQSLLAFLYYDGRGVTRDYNQAVAWAQKSAAQKDVFGEMVLSSLYKEGKGVSADPQKSAYWARQAADQKTTVSIWSQLDKKTPSGFTLREAITMGLAGFNAVMGDLDEQGRRENCDYTRQTCK